MRLSGQGDSVMALPILQMKKIVLYILHRPLSIAEKLGAKYCRRGKRSCKPVRRQQQRPGDSLKMSGSPLKSELHKAKRKRKSLPSSCRSCSCQQSHHL